MTARKCVTPAVRSRHICSGKRVKDEVYRQMFLLEESRPGAGDGPGTRLAARMAYAESKTANDEEQDWLKKISPDLPGDD